MADRDVSSVPFVVVVVLAMAWQGCTEVKPRKAVEASISSSRETIDSITPNRSQIADPADLQALSYTDLSTDFIHSLMHDRPVDAHLQLLATLNPDSLDAALNTPSQRLTFWINIYNGYTKYFLQEDPSLYQRNRGSFFAKQQIPIAGYKISLEDIEHGVLRRGAITWAKGYLRFLVFRNEFIQRFAVETVDYRIHFALNCGARSCPPVAAYREDAIARQLDANSRYYLQKEAAYDAVADIVKVPALMSWFSADFGGDDTDKREILRAYGVVPEGAKPQIIYLNYDWTMDLNNVQSYDI